MVRKHNYKIVLYEVNIARDRLKLWDLPALIVSNPHEKDHCFNNFWWSSSCLRFCRTRFEKCGHVEANACHWLIGTLLVVFIPTLIETLDSFYVECTTYSQFFQFFSFFFFGSFTFFSFFMRISGLFRLFRFYLEKKRVF